MDLVIPISEAHQKMMLGVGWLGGREAQEEGDIYILIADSCCCIAETNTTL